MGTPTSRHEEISTQKTPNHRSVSALWKGPAPVSATPLAALPLAALEIQDHAAVVNTERQRACFSGLLAQIKQNLGEAKRQSVLARGRSSGLAQRQKCAELARSRFLEAKKQLIELHGVARGLGLEERRRARAVEGSPEWRLIHHAICRATEGLPKGKGMAA